MDSDSDCDCYSSFARICSLCHYKLEEDYFNAICLLVASGADVSRFGIDAWRHGLLQSYNEDTADNRDRRRRGLMKIILENRPNR
ncbi:MAG: hypothetical protein EBZ36_15735 [Acidobacteria bacterium]|nr:hypothetical protein [Acidobacteriota bacterium]